MISPPLSRSPSPTYPDFYTLCESIDTSQLPPNPDSPPHSNQPKRSCVRPIPAKGKSKKRLREELKERVKIETARAGILNLPSHLLNKLSGDRKLVKWKELPVCKEGILSPKQIRDLMTDSLNPARYVKPFSADEIEFMNTLLPDLIKTKTVWSKLSNELFLRTGNYRPANDIKNKFYAAKKNRSSPMHEFACNLFRERA